MKFNFKNVLTSVAFMGSVGSALAQSTATYLQFPHVNDGHNEYGYSTCEFNGHSAVGTLGYNSFQFYKNNQFQFRAVGPAGTRFGHSLAMNSNWLVAGAPFYDATPSNTSTSNHGAIMLSKTVNGNYVNNFNITLTAQTPTHNDQFGESIDIDGTWLVVGANQTAGGKGYIEIWSQNSANTTWNRIQKIQPSSLVNGANFGYSVAIKGNFIVVGAPGVNKIFLFKNNNSVWSQVAEYTPNISTWGSTTQFGWDVDITDGNLIVGDPSAMKAAIFSINNTTGALTLTHTLLHPTSVFSGYFGESVAIQYNRALVGAYRSFHPYNPPTNPPPAGPYKGNVFFFTDGYVYKGRMNTPTVSGVATEGLGGSVAIDSDNVLAGARFTNNSNVGVSGSYGAAYRMPFWQAIGFMRESTTSEEDPTVELTTIMYPTSISSSEGLHVNVGVGKIMKAYAFSISGGMNELAVSGNNINTSSLPTGVYTITIETETGKYSEKIVKE